MASVNYGGNTVRLTDIQALLYAPVKGNLTIYRNIEKLRGTALVPIDRCGDVGEICVKSAEADDIYASVTNVVRSVLVAFPEQMKTRPG